MAKGTAIDHFWGKRDRPLAARDLVRRNPILATAEIPVELRNSSMRRAIYVATEGTDEPNPEVKKIKTADGRTTWQVSVPDSTTEPTHRMGETAERHELRKICAEIDPAVGAEGHRPEWLNQAGRCSRYGCLAMTTGEPTRTRAIRGGAWARSSPATGLRAAGRW